MAKPKRKQDDKQQSKRFIQKAREVVTDKSGETFDKAFRKIVPPKTHRNPKQDAP